MSNKPTHDLCIISGEGKAAVWTRVAALWPTKDGDGFSGEIPTGFWSQAALSFRSARRAKPKSKTSDQERAAGS